VSGANLHGGVPRVAVRGTPHERGVQYGRAARERVQRSVSAYEWVFAHYAGWDWPKVRREAARYLEPIADFHRSAVEEMHGIAVGAGLELDDVIALNVRSEIMFASGAGASGAMSSAMANECSSFAVLPDATLSGHTIAGQNWDWLLHAQETVVQLNVVRDDGPDYMTIVEAGLLAKTGMNEAGVAVCTNTLVSHLDEGKAGVPYHVLLRALLDAESITDAVATIFAADKALSANYLLADVDGLAVDLEVVPGGPQSVRVLMPDTGILSHTNHFLAPDFVRCDAHVATSPNTLFRLECLRAALVREAPAITVESLAKVLSDHRNAPLGICCHGDERAAEAERFATIVSVIYDLDAREVHVAGGTPCVHPFATRESQQVFDASGGEISAPNAEEES
jgi:isopenicillin-N N-acyltransferase like protein